MPTRAVYQPRSVKQKHIWRSCISPARYINGYQQLRHIWRRCMSPARCSCISTAIKNQSESTSGRHIHVDQGGISRAQQSKKHVWRSCVPPARQINSDQQSESISELCINGNQKIEAKELLDDTAVSTIAVYQPRSARQKHIRRSCISV